MHIICRYMIICSVPLPLLMIYMQAVARKFNQLQRREAVIGGTQSLIDLRRPSSYFDKNITNKAVRRSSQRPRSSGGRMTATQTTSSTKDNNSTCHPARVQVALPCLAGATLQRKKDGGGFKAVRPPPLRASKGLPSYTQVNEGFARKRAKERKLASNANAINNNSTASGGGFTNNVTDLGAGIKEEFAVHVARRDDILQVGTRTVAKARNLIVVFSSRPSCVRLLLAPPVRHM